MGREWLVEAGASGDNFRWTFSSILPKCSELASRTSTRDNLTIGHKSQMLYLHTNGFRKVQQTQLLNLFRRREFVMETEFLLMWHTHLRSFLDMNYYYFMQNSFDLCVSSIRIFSVQSKWKWGHWHLNANESWPKCDAETEVRRV